MRKVYEIKDEELIKNILENAEFGTLAICMDNKPYSVPLNFVEINGEIFIHGAKKGKKIEIMNNNNNASFSVVESYSLLPSYFSTDDGRASPATHMFKSIILDGHIEFIEDYDVKANALEMLMQKYQKEGGYKALSDVIYKKIINATCIYKLVPSQSSAKFHLGQDYNEQRFARVKEHLLKRGTKKDLDTLKLMESLRV
ncbi:pyridoxamine 5'-phosphate oxidase family protein [Poseidonibacter lekithochrous]|uniref:pyridoxamine 5'-phosphate oxidase family protein n=1 Tax=Poseidonibacter lekithochrous TaxID=1904463 RepID=UPI000D3644CC|nr:pyridoxamine 5'-phosphate oxidase family protein [Poseidonibacter lekithochrous]